MRGLQLVDLNRDGAPDIASYLQPSAAEQDPRAPFYLNDGHGNFTQLPPGDGTDAGDWYVFADVDGDGGHDIVYTDD